MNNRQARILKSNKVSVRGSVCLGPGGGVAPARTATSAQTGGCVTAQQARIIESNTEYAIIEIVCSCGSKSHVQCNYAEA